MMDTSLAHEFARRALDLVGPVLAEEPLVQHTIGTFASVLERTELDVLDTIRSRSIDLADPTSAFPEDLVRIAGIFGLGPEPGMETETFRERLRLFVQAYLQGAGTPRSILTMAAAELGVLLGGPAHHQGTEWIQAVRRPGLASGVIRLEENPIYRVEKRPVLAKTGIRWTIDNPGNAGGDLVYPQVVIEALVDDVRGPSIIFEDIGMAWLCPSVVLERGDKLVLQSDLEGIFSAWKHAESSVEEVTEEIQLIGQVPDERALDRGIPLSGGHAGATACAYMRSATSPHVVRLCARSNGRWGNGLSLRCDTNGRARTLIVEFDDYLAATGTPGKSANRWILDAGDDIITALTTQLRGRNFLLEAQEATLFLPAGRSHWMYLDHKAVLSEDGGLKNLARLLLNYTRYGHAAHHNTDNYDVFRFDRDDTRFGRANYTVEEERVRITYSWREPKATAIQLEVPLWIENEENIEARNRAYQRLSDGILRIKPAGVAVSLLRTLPQESMGIGEVFPDHVTVDMNALTQLQARPSAEVMQHGGVDIAALARTDSSFMEPFQVAVSDSSSLTVAIDEAVEMTGTSEAATKLASAMQASVHPTANLTCTERSAMSTTPQPSVEQTTQANMSTTPQPSVEQTTQANMSVGQRTEVPLTSSVEADVTWSPLPSMSSTAAVGTEPGVEPSIDSGVSTNTTAPDASAALQQSIALDETDPTHQVNSITGMRGDTSSDDESP